MTTQTPDAVREALEQRAIQIITEERGAEWATPKIVRAMMRFRDEAALDSRAGNAGEGLAYRCRGCGWRGSEPIANGHPQNGCDLELMVHDPIATPAPAVDAGPAGEVRKMVETLRGEMAAAPKRDWYPVHRDYLDAILSAALSHGEGRK